MIRMEHDFSAFVFKIQANMNKSTSVTVLHLCESVPESLKPAWKFIISRVDKKITSFPATAVDGTGDVMIIDEAYAGDIIGVFDPGIFSIGDTSVYHAKDNFAFEGIPTFAPEHFARVRQVDTMKRKQFVKGDHADRTGRRDPDLSRSISGGMEEIIVGVVGVLQFDVLKYRLENEYNVEIRLETASL